MTDFLMGCLNRRHKKTEAEKAQVMGNGGTGADAVKQWGPRTHTGWEIERGHLQMEAKEEPRENPRFMTLEELPEAKTMCRFLS